MTSTKKYKCNSCGNIQHHNLKCYNCSKVSFIELNNIQADEFPELKKDKLQEGKIITNKKPPAKTRKPNIRPAPQKQKKHEGRIV